MATYTEVTSQLSHIDPNNLLEQDPVTTDKLTGDLVDYSIEHNNNLVQPEVALDHLTFVVTGTDEQSRSTVFTRKGNSEYKEAATTFREQTIKTFAVVDVLPSEVLTASVSDPNKLNPVEFLRREAQLKKISIQNEHERLIEERNDSRKTITSKVFLSEENYNSSIQLLSDSPAATKSSTLVVCGDMVTTSQASQGAIFAIVIKKGNLQNPGDQVLVKMLAGPNAERFDNPQIVSHQLGLAEGDEAIILNASSSICLLDGKKGAESKFDGEVICQQLEKLVRSSVTHGTTQKLAETLVHSIDAQIMRDHGKEDHKNKKKLLLGADLVLTATVTSAKKKAPIYNTIISDPKHPLAAQCMAKHANWNIQTALWKEDIKQKLELDVDTLDVKQIEKVLKEAIYLPGFKEVANPLMNLWEHAKLIEKDNKIIERRLHLETSVDKPAVMLNTFRQNLIKIAAAKHAVNGILDATKELRAHLGQVANPKSKSSNAEVKIDKPIQQIYAEVNAKIDGMQKKYVDHLKVPRTSGYNWFWKALDAIRQVFRKTKTHSYLDNAVGNFKGVVKQVDKAAPAPVLKM